MNSLIAPVEDEKGNIIGTLAVKNDVSDLTHVQHELHAERRLFQMLIDNIPYPVYIKNRNSEFTRVNKVLSDLMKVDSVESLNDKTDFDYYPQNDAQRFFDEEQKIMNSGVPLINKVEKYKWNDGVEIWFSTTKIPMKDDEGKCIGIVGISYDITDQVINKKSLELARLSAENANNAKSTFLSNMSHEIRTPLNEIIGMSDVLNLTDLDEEQKEILNVIIRSGNNLLNIINDVLDLSKIETDKFELEQSLISINKIVNEVVKEMSFAVKGNENELEFDVDRDDSLAVLGDSHRIKQILLNLVGNALKFTNKGHIKIVAKWIDNSNSKQQGVAFQVIDNGIGMDVIGFKDIIESYTQADKSTTQKFGGAGFELFISSKLIDQMGGELKMNSKKGIGTTFYFELYFDKADVLSIN
jgi:PAS domain S-box-containing protein